MATNVSEKEARDVVEAAREADWKLPSFGKQLFLGDFRLDLIHPQPKLDSEQIEKGTGVTVNCVTPGLIETDMVATIPPYMVADLVERIPQHRMGHPEEIARVVCFLAQDASGYITGQIWDVDGGINM